MVCGPDLADMVFCRNVQGRHAYDISSLTDDDSLKHAGMCTFPEKKHENSIRTAADVGKQGRVCGMSFSGGQYRNAAGQPFSNPGFLWL